MAAGAARMQDRSVTRLAALAVMALALSGCGNPYVAPAAATPAASGTHAAQAPLAEWPFAQASVAGTRASADTAVTAATLPRLGVAWTAPTVGGVTGTPTVLGGRVYVATWAGHVLALEAGTGAVAWDVTVGAQVDGSVTLADGKALVGDAAGRLHALDAVTGREVWSVVADAANDTHLYATPLVVPAHGGRASFVVQGVGSDQESARLHGDRPIDFRGSVAAYALADGKPLWRTWLVPAGLTGAPVWGTPVYDAGSDRIVLGTGNAYTAPAGNMTDALVGLDAADGHVAWRVQATPGDVFTQKHPDSPDHDFGATPALVQVGGRTLAVVGAKSAVVWAVDVGSGAVAWTSGHEEGGEGVIGDAAAGDGVVLVPYVTLQKVAALGTRDGAVRWSVALNASGFSDPVAVQGAFVAADASGAVRGLDAAMGAVLWSASVGKGGVFGGLSVAEGALYVPVVRDGFLGKEGAVVAFAPGATGAGVVAAGPASAGTTVRMTGYAFTPPGLHVSVGTKVHWTNEDPVYHTVTSDGGDFGAMDVKVDPGMGTDITFDHAGTFSYYCKPHSAKGDDGQWHGMVATITVG